MSHKCTVKKERYLFTLECTECMFKGVTYNFKHYHKTTISNHLNMHKPPKINISHGYTKEVAKICNKEYFEHVLTRNGTQEMKAKYFNKKASDELYDSARRAPKRLGEIFSGLDVKLKEYKDQLDNILITI